MLRQVGRASRILSSAIHQKAALEAVRALPAPLLEHVSKCCTKTYSIEVWPMRLAIALHVGV